MRLIAFLIVLESINAKTLPILSALGSGPPINARNIERLFNCSRALRLPSRARNIENALLTITDVGI